jgi:isoamylase
VIRLRREHPALRRRDFFAGGTGGRRAQVHWLRPDGQEMSEADWNEHFARSVGMYIVGRALIDVDSRGRPLTDQDLLLLFNAHHEPIDFALPEPGAWSLQMDTATADGEPDPQPQPRASSLTLEARSLAVLTRASRP